MLFKKIFFIALIGISSIANGQYSKLLDFNGTNGSGANSSLISDGTFLYGMTSSGGANGTGTIIKIKPDGTGFNKLYDFGIPYSGGISDGNNPFGSLIYDGTYLYGMTEKGGNSNSGTMFKIKTDGTGYIKLLNFGTGSVTGVNPRGSFFSDGTFFYGMTILGGVNNKGVIFKVKPDGTGCTILFDFAGTSNGQRPWGSLISDGTYLYGMTFHGGTSGVGVVFKIKPDGTNYSKLLDFNGSNGAGTFGDLIYDGTYLYGMTGRGGASDSGLVFKLKPDGTGYTNLLDFTGVSNGTYPYGSLISDGTFLYGTNTSGGANNSGVVFKIKPNGTGYTKLLDFGGWFGYFNEGSLFSDGTFLYGMTGQGGVNNLGTIFKLGINSNLVEIPEKETKPYIGIFVFPNPTKEIIGFKGESLNEKRVKLEIRNVLGQIVFQRNEFDLMQKVSMNELPNGIYFVLIENREGQRVMKVVKE